MHLAHLNKIFIWQFLMYLCNIAEKEAIAYRLCVCVDRFVGVNLRF